MNTQITLPSLTVLLCFACGFRADAFAQRSHREITRVPTADSQPFMHSIAQNMSAKDYVKRAKAKSGKGELQGAIADYTEAIKLKPDDATNYFARGNERLVLADLKGAIEDFDRAIKIKPDYADAYNNRGVAHKQLGNKQGAIADYQKAADLYQKQGKNTNAQRVRGAIEKLNR